MKEFLSGNEAVARGAWEAGVTVAAAYPGTPSTEIMATVATYKEMYAEWSVNEKVSFEVAYGAALSGRRALASMKHVGVNVASDALMTASYTGVNAGFVFISADDPGMHSSQNEQDNRIFGRFAQIPVLEPSDSSEAKEFTKLAYQISEEFDTPVMIRMTTRLCHGKGVVEFADRNVPEPKKYKKDPQKFVMVPGHARGRVVVVKHRTDKLREFSESVGINRVETGEPNIGIITSGIPYQYAKEAVPHASFLKLGMSNPLPMKLIEKFIAEHDTVYVVEELKPHLEEQIKAAGLEVIGKDMFPEIGELSTELIREKLTGVKPTPVQTELPPRPPVMCSGCPHRAVFSVLKKEKAVISGDIGCYTLSTLPPLNSMDAVLCMGASVGMAQGMVRAMDEKKARRVVSVLGDSTFIHSGIPSLVNAVYNRANITIVILDNRITAMTGHQDNPGTGKTLKGEDVLPFDFAETARVLGAGYVRTIDPIDMDATESVIKQAMEFDGVSVVVAKRPCVLVDRDQFDGFMQVDHKACTDCKRCLSIGCPSMSVRGDGVVIDETSCFGCATCGQICPHEAIVRVTENV